MANITSDCADWRRLSPAICSRLARASGWSAARLSALVDRVGTNRPRAGRGGIGFDNLHLCATLAQGCRPVNRAHRCRATAAPRLPGNDCSSGNCSSASLHRHRFVATRVQLPASGAGALLPAPDQRHFAAWLANPGPAAGAAWAISTALGLTRISGSQVASCAAARCNGAGSVVAGSRSAVAPKLQRPHWQTIAAGWLPAFLRGRPITTCRPASGVVISDRAR